MVTGCWLMVDGYLMISSQPSEFPAVVGEESAGDEARAGGRQQGLLTKVVFTLPQFTSPYLTSLNLFLLHPREFSKAHGASLLANPQLEGLMEEFQVVIRFFGVNFYEIIQQIGNCRMGSMLAWTYINFGIFTHTPVFLTPKMP